MQGVKGEAVVWTSPYVRLSEAFDKSIKLFTTLALSHSCRVVYATLGFIA